VTARLALALAVLALPVSTRADEALEPGTASAAATSNRINLRLGGATTDSTGHPTICVDVRIVAGVGVESCGTGEGILYDGGGVEMAHFRGTFSFLERATERGTGRLRGGVGWAELQVGVDHPGFRFGSPDGERGSVAGPEAAMQGQWLVPLKGGVEAVISMTVGAAYFASAHELITPRDRLQPFASFEVGLGW